MATAKSIPDRVQAVFPMLVCQGPEDEMNFCKAASGAVEQVRRPVDGKHTTTSRVVVSVDGRTMTQTTTGTNAQGQTVNNTAIWEKQ